MARNMAREKNRYFLARPTHDVHREQSLDESAPLKDCDPSQAWRKRLERLMAGQSAAICLVLQRLAEGCTLEEIAEFLGTSPQGLWRLLRSSLRKANQASSLHGQTP